jgi:hypothetical protein
MDENAPDSDVQALIEFLRERNAWCPACRYNLRGLTTPRCPECGRELRLSVGAVEPFLRTWITLAVASSASAGIGLLAMVGVVYAVVTRDWPPGRIMTAMLLYVALVPIGPIVLLTRQRFLRLSVVVQWRIAVIAVIVDCGAFALLLSTIGSG